MAAAQILAQKGIKLDLDRIGMASEMISYGVDEKVKQESGLLPQEKKDSTHTITTKKGSARSTEKETIVS